MPRRVNASAGRAERAFVFGYAPASETDCEHGTSSLVRTGRQFSTCRQSSIACAFPGRVRASVALDTHLAISAGAQPPPPQRLGQPHDAILGVELRTVSSRAGTRHEPSRGRRARRDDHVGHLSTRAGCHVQAFTAPQRQTRNQSQMDTGYDNPLLLHFSLPSSATSLENRRGVRRHGLPARRLLQRPRCPRAHRACDMQSRLLRGTRTWRGVGSFTDHCRWR